MDLDKITVPQLLAIPPDQPEHLFSSRDAIRGEYRALARRWHPDVLGGDGTPFAHLHQLHEAGLAKIARGEWLTPGVLELTGADGILRRVRYVKDYTIHVGHAYLGHEYVTYVIKDDFADLAETGSKRISTLKFPNASVRDGMVERCPTFKATFRTNDKIALVLNKPNNLVRLRDLLEHLNGQLDPRHVAWITSELLNLACYLEWSGLTHNDLSPETVFICPKKHTIKLLGGWWYAVPVGARMARLQEVRTVANLPSKVASSKLASVRTDLSLVRLLGREMLGDPGGSRLSRDKTVPAALATWLRTAPSDTAREDYRGWQEVLTASFGARRFVELDVDPSVIYKGVD